MISGTVNGGLEPHVDLTIRGPDGVKAVTALVDTGFSGSLMLPPALIAELGLPQTSAGVAALADGSRRNHGVYVAEVEWAGSRFPVLVYGLGTEALVGMRLLAGHELRMAVEPGGAVEIRPLPRGGV